MRVRFSRGSRIPLLGKGGERGGSVNFQDNSARLLIEPLLPRAANPSFAKEGNLTALLIASALGRGKARTLASYLARLATASSVMISQARAAARSDSQSAPLLP